MRRKLPSISAAMTDAEICVCVAMNFPQTSSISDLSGVDIGVR